MVSDDIQAFAKALPSKTSGTVEFAIALLWFYDHYETGASRSAGALAASIEDLGLGSKPHATRLRTDLQAHDHTILVSGTNRFKLNVASIPDLDAAFLPLLTSPRVIVSHQYLESSITDGTRPYIERIAHEINGAYQYQFFNSAAVLLRRLTETLVIEVFEAKSADAEITQNGQFMFLRDMIQVIRTTNSVTFSRGFADHLVRIKDVGDRAAHHRYYITSKGDLEAIAVSSKAVFSELIALANLQS